jgi:hypothetical protein
MAETDQQTFQAEQTETPPATTAPSEISWTASEYVHHAKTGGWYLALAVCAVLVAGLVYLISHDWVSVGVVIAAAAVFGSYGSRQPRQLDYHLDGQGIGIGPKRYRYGEFKSFSVIPEGAFSSITFMPLKRFSPPISIYYAPEDEEKILALLSQYLPFEEPRRDAVDSFMRRIRF